MGNNEKPCDFEGVLRQNRKDAARVYIFACTETSLSVLLCLEWLCICWRCNLMTRYTHTHEKKKYRPPERRKRASEISGLYCVVGQGYGKDGVRIIWC